MDLAKIQRTEVCIVNINLVCLHTLIMLVCPVRIIGYGGNVTIRAGMSHGQGEFFILIFVVFEV